MLLAVIMGSSRSGPDRFSMRLRTLRLRSRRILPWRCWVVLTLRFRLVFGIVALTRKAPKPGIMKMCSHIYYSSFFGDFRAFSRNLVEGKKISRLVEG